MPGSGTTPVATVDGEFSSTVVRDSLGRAYRRLGNNSQQVNYSYDNNGNLLTATDAQNHITPTTTMRRIASSR